ncbi:MAG: DUF503 domain-containing protein [bacterium]
MRVCTCLISLHIPGSNSLKSKRFILRRLKDRIRNKFNVSVAEVDDFDLWQRATLGVAVVSNDGTFGQQVISGVIGLVQAEKSITIIDIVTDVR